jgi:hypothetical protein
MVLTADVLQPVAHQLQKLLICVHNHAINGEFDKRLVSLDRGDLRGKVQILQTLLCIGPLDDNAGTLPLSNSGETSRSSTRVLIRMVAWWGFFNVASILR